MLFRGVVCQQPPTIQQSFSKKGMTFEVVGFVLCGVFLYQSGTSVAVYHPSLF